jgi:choline-sulfatase
MRLPGIAAVLATLCAVHAQTRPPVILISIDTLRADHLSAYGYRKIHTPNIDALARGGTLFGDISTQIPLTLPSHTSLFTSTYPFQNGIEENAERVLPGAVTLAGVLRAQGYRTAAFVGSVLLDRRLGLDQGFEVYDSPFNLDLAAAENPYAVRVRRDGALVFRAARQWLDENRGRPVFLFVHLFDLHEPYGQPARPGVSGYDSQIEYVDTLIGRFRQALEQTGWWDRSLVVLLSDHGESLGEHGEDSHGYFIYRSTTWVPLLMHWPAGAANLSARSDMPGGLIDVAPTILDFLKIPAPPSFVGSSLLSGRVHPVYTESVYPRDAFHWGALRGLRAGVMQFIAAPKPELYNLQRDPAEQVNLAARDAAQAEALRNQLTGLLTLYRPSKPAANAAIAPQARAVLGSLGYAAAGSNAAGDSGPDPKDRLPEYRLYEKALADLYAGREAAAIAGFSRLVTQDPKNLLARYYLGEAYLKAGKPDEAARQWAATLERDPGYAAAGEALGALWLGRGDAVKARQYLELTLKAAPQDYTALVELGLMEEKQGQLPEAERHLQAACKIALDPAPCERELHGLESRTSPR